MVLDSTNASTGRHWLRTEVMALGAPGPEAFFGRFEVKSKVSQIVLPVFFGRADACVVDRSGFRIMREMNPQVGRRLKVLKESEPYLDTIACVRVGGWDAPHYRQDLIRALEEMDEEPAGQQIMNLFRFDSMKRFEDGHIETLRKLRRRHDALAAELARESEGGVVR
jgi:phosphonate transport system substrate-binding protein